MNFYIFCELLHSEINKAIEFINFPSSMKIAVITPVYKKGSQSVVNDTRRENCFLLNLVQEFVEIEGSNRSLVASDLLMFTQLISTHFVVTY